MIRSYELIDKNTINAPVGLINIFNYSTVDSRGYRFFENSRKTITYTDNSAIDGLLLKVINLRDKFTITNNAKEIALRTSNFINSNDKISTISISGKNRIELVFPLYLYISGRHKIRTVEKFKTVEVKTSYSIDRSVLSEILLETSYKIDKSNISSFSYWSDSYIFLESYESKYIEESLEKSVFHIKKSEAVNTDLGIVDGDSCLLFISNGSYILPTYLPSGP